MPEGDSIFRAARALHRALAGHHVVRFESVLPALTRVHEDAPLTGRTIERVTAAGKHLLIHFSGNLVLRTHMRMNGSWHIYRPGERWRRPRRDMRLLIATEAFEAIAFTVPVAEFLEGSAVVRQQDLRLMGPDLLGETFDQDEAIRRIRERNTESIADVLLNQRVVAGIGNIYKSEVLFMRGIDPFAPARLVAEDELRLVLSTARKLLKANVTTLKGGIVTYTGYRRTGRNDPAERRYLYGRAGRPCRKCGSPIRVGTQGPHARLTYWCPKCQQSRS